jgi:hypothetical protein
MTRLKAVSTVNAVQNAQRRAKDVRAAGSNTELEGSRITNAALPIRWPTSAAPSPPLCYVIG